MRRRRRAAGPNRRRRLRDPNRAAQIAGPRKRAQLFSNQRMNRVARSRGCGAERDEVFSQRVNKIARTAIQREEHLMDERVTTRAEFEEEVQRSAAELAEVV